MDLAAETSRKLHILGHNRLTLGVNRTEVGVLEEANDVRLGRLL